MKSLFAQTIIVGNHGSEKYKIVMAKFAKQYNFGKILGGWHAFKVYLLVGLFLEVEYSKIDFQPKSSLLYSTSYRKLTLTWIKKEWKKPCRLLKVEYSILDFH